MDRYQYRRNNKNLLMVHLIFVTKYRKPLLPGNFRKIVLASLYDACMKNHWYIRKMETDIDHVHIPFSTIQRTVSHTLFNHEAAKYMDRMEARGRLLVQALLERAHIMVGWLFCCIHRAGITEHD